MPTIGTTIKAPKYAPPPHSKRMAELAAYHGVPPRQQQQQAMGQSSVPTLDFGSQSGGGRPASTGPYTGASGAQSSLRSPQQPFSQSQRSVLSASVGGGGPRSPLPAVKPVTPKPNARSDGSDLSHSVVVSAGEYYGIHALAANTSAGASEQQMKHERREQSKARYKNWGNTLEALREKKKRDRAERLAAAEREQQKIDETEAHVQAEQRQSAIDRAGRLMYQENDRVKEFHTALLLSSVLKERSAQIELNRVKKQHAQRIDKMQFEAIKATVARLKAVEDADLVERRAKSKELADIQEKQLIAVHERRRQELLEEVRIGEINRKLAIEAVAEQRALEQERKHGQFAFNLEYLRMNEEQKKIKAENSKLEALEDAKIKEYAAEKERTLAQRKQVEEERFKAKHQQYQVLLKKQFDHLQKVKNEEQARIDRHAAELMKKTDEKHAAETLKRNTTLDDLKKTRARQLARAKQERAERLADEKAAIEQWAKHAAAQKEQDREAARAARRAAEANQDFLKQQAIDARTRAQAQKIDDLEYSRMQEVAYAREEAELQRYAEGAIADFDAMGKATIPLKIALRGQKSNGLRPTAGPLK